MEDNLTYKIEELIILLEKKVEDSTEDDKYDEGSDYFWGKSAAYEDCLYELRRIVGR